MLFKINAKVFEKILSKVLPVVPSKTPTVALENFLIEISDNKLTVTASDSLSTITISTEIYSDQNLEFLIPAKLTYDIIKSLEDLDITFEIADNSRLLLTTDMGTYHISYLPKEGYPNLPVIPEERKLHLDGDLLQRLFSKAVFAISKDTLRPAMTGMLMEFSIDGLRVVSTDGHRLVKFTYSGIEFEQPETYIIPEKAVQVLIKLMEGQPVLVYLSTTHLKFEIDNIHFSIRLIDQKFPEYNAVIPVSSQYEMKIKKSDLLNSVKRMVILSSINFPQTVIDLKSDAIEVYSEDQSKGTSGKEVIPCSYNGPDMTIGFKSQYLIDMMSHIDTEELIFKFNSPSKATLLLPSPQEESEEYILLLMPIRLSK